MTIGFNLLRKCLPGTRKMYRIEMLMKTVSYIKELENKVNEKESLKESKKRVKYIKELENKVNELEKESKRENYIKELQNKIKELEKKSTSQTLMDTDSAPREPLMSYRSLKDLDTGLISYSSEMADLTTRTGASESSPSCAMDDHSVILESLRNKILGTPKGTSEFSLSSPMDVRTTSEAEWGTTDEEELPEFNTVEDLREWLGLSMDDTTTSEEIPEFNTAEDLRQWLGL
jgi:DNA primase